jgi:HSP20 family molecular chaperone IbpA
MQDDMQNMLSGIFSGMSKEFISKNKHEKPFDILENENTIEIYIEIPGINKSDISVEIFNNKLKLVCSKKCPYDPNNYTNKKILINYSDVSQVITLPICISNKDNIKLKMENGVLFITLDKKAEKTNAFVIGIN